MKNCLHYLLCAGLVSSVVGVSQAAGIDEVVGKAVLTNPDVLAKWHQFKASGFDRDVVWGRYLPTLDVILGVGEERKVSPTLEPGLNEYSISSSRITLRQNLFEGFATENDSKRLDHVSVVRFYELLGVSETAALEAARAYVDVYRFRKLVELAEENYATHRLVYESINERSKAGVGRGVDLETAAGRLALAESNLLTEAANLHDVTARYQRIVGELPKGDIDPPAQLAKSLPKSRSEAIQAGFQNSPQLKAAVENILATQRNVAVQRAGYYPRVDVFAESARDKNLEGVIGKTITDTMIGLTVSINLFRGRQDSSRASKAAEDVNAAKDTRERVCRDLRQDLGVAYNEHLRLTEQLALLDQHQLATDKVREALRRQFDIGQRTLLDVLDTENEFFTARRSYVNGEMDLAVAHLKYLAAAGNLLNTLKLKPLEAVPPQPQTALDDDATNSCPPEPAMSPTFVRERQPLVQFGDYVALLENPDGSTGKVIIKGSKGEQVIDKALQRVPLDGSKTAAPVSDEMVKRDFAEAMAARPPLPEHFLLHFETGKTKLTASSVALLPKIFASIANRPVAEITIVGHTDTVGSVKINDALGLKRANFVAQKIKAQGLKVESVSVESRGERELLVPTPDNTPEPRNRSANISVR